jgi:hypothetical protein
MSSVVISGNTSGTITLDAPAVAGTTTLTLPATSGTVLTSASNTNFPAGSVLQVVQTTYSTTVSTSSSSSTDTGLNASITPTSASNKILIMCAPTFRASSLSSTDDAFVYGVLWRGAIDSGTSLINGFAMVGCRNSDFRSVPNMTYLDSPATTSSVTYRLSMNSQNANTVYINSGTTPSVMILMEIKG